MKKKLIAGALGLLSLASFSFESKAAGYSEVGQYGRPFVLTFEDTEEQIQEEIRLGEMEVLAQLVEAEAGNQSFEGKCLVVDVILNRVESPDFPNTISEVIFQEGQFSVVSNGTFDEAGWNMKEDDYAAVLCEMQLHQNKDVLYFNNCSSVSGKGEKFKVGGHWFRNG